MPDSAPPFPAYDARVDARWLVISRVVAVVACGVIGVSCPRRRDGDQYPRRE